MKIDGGKNSQLNTHLTICEAAVVENLEEHVEHFRGCLLNLLRCVCCIIEGRCEVA